MNNMTQSQKQFEVLNWASLFLEKHDREKKVAEILLQHHLNVTRSEFFMNMHDILSPEMVAAFKEDIRKHVKTGVPVQHLTGYESFYGRDFNVNKHVLIPRPETEELVQHIIQSVDKHAEQIIVDVGTGSGVIAITLALELPHAIVYATDISEDALKVARQNAVQLGASVQFLEGDFLQPFSDHQLQADIIVSNPPYIARIEEPFLSDTVKNFDPELALFADEEGLAAYKKIIKNAPKAIKSEAMLAFEIGHKQSEAVQALIHTTFPKSESKIIRDINGKERIVSAKIRK